MKLPTIIRIMFFEESRKVSFGFWLYVTATWLLAHPAKLIDGQTWMLCMGAASALIGGGTLADKYLAKKDAPPPPAA